ncbi:acylphosphatase [Roseisalinus antarcticus]|uniref:acylphosphatase n=1 Tax=Roseisalinus antarcticus TaxID=254357 RepID=A0A1Y5U532_9RHOB|nr:acylphosphatase [Roseisalinus antarcticus]SLN77400.1 Acylphosphatase [Roseisalinus antarcticus]
MKAVGIRVTGRVQGVSYRAWTRQEARGLGLAGWVRNAEDGSVRAHVEGPEDAVDQLLSRLRTGPAFAQVREVAATPAEPQGLSGFEIHRG